MQPYLWVRVQKIPHGLRFVCRQIVENNVDLLPRPALRNHLAEEIHEVGAGVARRCFPMNPSGFGIECRVQRQRSMPVILEPVALGTARRQR